MVRFLGARTIIRRTPMRYDIQLSITRQAIGQIFGASSAIYVVASAWEEPAMALSPLGAKRVAAPSGVGQAIWRTSPEWMVAGGDVQRFWRHSRRH